VDPGHLMIAVEIKRTETVSEEAAVKIAHEFAEWLEARGFQLVPLPGSLAAAEKDRPYEDLAQEFVGEWG
jgi:hypothetical protein